MIMQTGGYSISFISWSTAFKSDNDDYESSTFSKFRGYRADIARQLAANNPNFNGGIDPLTGYPIEQTITSLDTTITGGYGATSQEVMIPAFLAAYGGRDPSSSKLTAFPSIPLPNWGITYDGLIRIPAIKKRFKSFSLGHAYRSTYSVGNYTTNLDYGDGDNLNINNMSYHVSKEISQITINEQFSPLFKIDMTWKNSLITKVEIKKSRVCNWDGLQNTGC
jgi:cell surface protein SprA